MAWTMRELLEHVVRPEDPVILVLWGIIASYGIWGTLRARGRLHGPEPSATLRRDFKTGP
jgi:hypothetical protein